MTPMLAEVDLEPLRKNQDARWTLARRVAKSVTFAKSEQLPRLLLYVCKMELSDRGNEINEHKIGVDVFGRSPNYDPAADGIVRSHATRLRQRLELYFNGEGSAEELRIEIPRGGYVPRFYSVITKAAVEEMSHPTAELVKESTAESGIVGRGVDPSISSVKTGISQWNVSLWIKPFLCGLVCAAILVAVLWHLKHDAAQAKGSAENSQTAVERQFWSTLFPQKGRTLVVTGDSGLVLYETVTGHEVTLTEYLNGDYRDPDKEMKISSIASKALTLNLASRRYTSFVDLALSSELTRLPQWSPDRSQTIFARDLRASDAESSNLILVGSRQANPWVALIEPSLNFVLLTDGKAGYHFLNRHPIKGEEPEYIPKPEAGNLGASTVYGQVAYLPNPSGKGMVLALGGLWMSGTQSAGNFVLNRNQFAAWLKSITNKDGTIPPFELLISTKNLQGSATSSSILAQRIGKP